MALRHATAKVVLANFIVLILRQGVVRSVQPGYLREIRGFPSPSRERFGGGEMSPRRLLNNIRARTEKHI